MRKKALHIILCLSVLSWSTGLLYAQAASQQANTEDLLTGLVLGSLPSVDYSQSGYPASYTVNTPTMAFDGDLNTYYASYERSMTYVGLDLGQPYIITRLAYAPRNDGYGPNRLVLGVFEGANQPDFSDAIPLYIITRPGIIGQLTEQPIQVSRGVRYVRYVGPADARCNIAEIAFYGYPGQGDDTQLYQLTNLPTVSIHIADYAGMNSTSNTPAHVTLIDRKGARCLLDSAGVHWRGNASLDFPKKPYLIHFAHKQQPLDAPAKAKKWCLISNYGDKTLMRNLIAYDFSRRLEMPYTVFSTPVDVLINGEYQGCYQFADHIDPHPQRLPIAQMDKNDNSQDALTGGYHIEMDGYYYKEPHYFFSSSYYVPISIHEPQEPTNEQCAYIQNHFNRLEQYMKQFSSSAYQQYLDIASFSKHFLIGELSGNTDTYWSMHLFKKRWNDTLFCGPEWDFDIAFDNDYRHAPVSNKSTWLYLSAGSNCAFVDRIIQDDPTTMPYIEALWQKARNQHGLDPDTICALIDSIAQDIDASQRLNFLRWPILSTQVHMNPQAAGSFQAEIYYLKDFLRTRFQWMDNKLHYTPQTALPYTHAAPQCRKTLCNGQLRILRDNNQYDILGNQIKQTYE